MTLERMDSERKEHGSRPVVLLTRLQTDKKLALLISVVLVALVSFASVRNRSSSPYVSKRFGLGAGDTTGELKTALKRKGDGRAAVAILRVIDPNDPDSSAKYLVQTKSHDYPIPPFRGTVCLLGGNANAQDATPLDTLKRELNEELQSPNWVDDINPATVIDDSSLQSSDNRPLLNSTVVAPLPGTVRYLGTTLHFQSAELLSKPSPYAFQCALYEIILSPEQLPPGAIYPRGANVQEGRVVLLTEDQLVRHSKYAWGYEHTMERYFGKKTVNKQKGTAVSVVEEKAVRETVWTPAK